MKTRLQKVTLSTLFVFTLLFSAKGQTWDTIMNGVQKYSFAPYFYPDCSEILVLNGQTILGASLTGIYKSTNYGDTWQRQTSGAMQGYNGVRKANSNRILALGLMASAPILKSDDNGDTWANSATGIPNGVIVEDLSLTPNGTIYIASRSTSGNAAVYVSSDNGDTWTLKSTGLPNAPTSTLWSILAINDTVILAGASSGIYKTTDAGDNWTSVQSSGTDYVMCLKKNTNGSIYASYTSNSIYKSIDNGTTWTSTSLVGSSKTVNDFEFDSDGNIYVGVFLDGITKYDISENIVATIGSSANGLMNTRINDLTIDESGTDLVIFASCVGSSNTQGYFYRYGYTSNGNNTSVDNFSNNTTFLVYPNPTNHLITIELDVLSLDNTPTSISLFNVYGSIVLEQNVVGALTDINIQNYPKGVYFLKLETATKSFAKKIIIE